jgi:hypothetical protein
VIVFMALAATACTGGHSHPGAQSSAPGGSTLAASPAVSSAPPASASPSVSPSDPTIVHAAITGTMVVSAATPARTAVLVSRALFTSAPVVVVAPPKDPAGVAAGAQEAERIGVPLLLLDADATAPAGAVPTKDVFAAELRRLGVTSVLAIGSSAADVTAAVPDVHVVTDATQLEAPVAAADAEQATVLVRAGGDAASAAIAAAATATAHAAGAIVIPVQSGDPRRDPTAIAALAENPPHNVLAVGAEFGAADVLTSRLAVAATGTQLPGGGQVFFPGRRLVALYGHPGGPALGVLGAQDVGPAITRVKLLAAGYAPLSSVPVVPAFEIIATVAQAAAGDDGNFSSESTVESLLPWVQQANAAGLYVVLDLQPGTSEPLDQAKRYARLLEMPNVGLAIDPEWALKPGQQPLGQIGSVDAAQINVVGAWLDQLTAAKHLPQKLLVVHQFRLSMIGNEAALKTDYEDVAVLIHMDGQGGMPNKIATWNSVVRTAPKGVPFGWKNFYLKDHPVLTPEQTMAQKPAPVMISYQ